MPIGGRHALDGWPEIEKACEVIDRDPKTVEVSMFGAKPDPAFLDDLESKGLVGATLTLPQGARYEVMATVEEFAKLVDR